MTAAGTRSVAKGGLLSPQWLDDLRHANPARSGGDAGEAPAVVAYGSVRQRWRSADPR